MSIPLFFMTTTPEYSLGQLPLSHIYQTDLNGFFLPLAIWIGLPRLKSISEDLDSGSCNWLRGGGHLSWYGPVRSKRHFIFSEKRNLILLKKLLTEMVFSSLGAWTSDWEEVKKKNPELWLEFIHLILSLVCVTYCFRHWEYRG